MPPSRNDQNTTPLHKNIYESRLLRYFVLELIFRGAGIFAALALLATFVIPIEARSLDGVIAAIRGAATTLVIFCPISHFVMRRHVQILANEFTNSPREAMYASGMYRQSVHALTIGGLFLIETVIFLATYVLPIEAIWWNEMIPEIRSSAITAFVGTAALYILLWSHTKKLDAAFPELSSRDNGVPVIEGMKRAERRAIARANKKAAKRQAP